MCYISKNQLNIIVQIYTIYKYSMQFIRNL